MKYFQPRCQKWATFKTHVAGGIFPLGFAAGFPWRLLRKEPRLKLINFVFLRHTGFPSATICLFVKWISWLYIWAGFITESITASNKQRMLNKVLLDSCSRFNVLNFPRSQKWNKYQKGSGSRVLVFLQEFWNPSFSSVMVRSQKNRSNNTQFLMKKVTYSQLSPTSCGTIFVASPRPVLCVLVSHNLRLNVPYFTFPSSILDARLGLQHGRRFIVLGHQYGRRDVMWKHSIRDPYEIRTAIGLVS